ncbi:MAG: hypothetical protein IKN54_05290, partial [Lachnospiraceae bacterium]|nr:hypothetical protein [Lachnospiraceae bacterium]
GMGVGRAESDITVNGVTVSSATINVSGNAKSCVGGLIGQFDGSTLENNRKLYIGQTAACAFGAAISGGSAATGGVIGKIGTEYVTQLVEGEEKSVPTIGAFDAKIGNTTITGSVTGTGNVGGLIASIVSSEQKQNRDLILTDVSTGLLIVENGSLLGDTWYDTEVQLGTSNSNGVKIGTSSDASTVKGSGDMAGLVNHATGQWIVNNVNITDLAVDSSSVSSFGVLVNKGYKTSSTKSALFIWLKNGYDYTITNISGFALDSASVFDEIVAYSANGDVTANGQGIVSIYTSSANGSLNMSGTANTYTGVTAWGQKANSHTRYYYNLDDLVRSPYNVTDSITSGLTAPKKLLAWSIQQYADSSLRAYFAAPYTNNNIGTATDNFDMTGLSYYPVNIDSGKSVTLNGKVTLYNEEIETMVATSENKKRSTLNPTQHYLMHNSIFNNVQGSLTVGTLELKGNVGKLESGLNSANGSGALICGSLGGTSSQAKANFIMSSAGEIKLNGIKVHNKDAYSPLLINKIQKNTIANINGVSTLSGAYSNGTQAASSLIGNVGSTDATDIQLDFSDIRLDARKTDSSLKSYSNTEILQALTALNEANAALETAEALALKDAIDAGTVTEEQTSAYQELVDAQTAAQNEYDKRNALTAATTALNTANTAFQTAKAVFETAIGIVGEETDEQIVAKYAAFISGHEAGTATQEQETAYATFLAAQEAQDEAQATYNQANACSDLDTAYHTTSSIFTRATLLEKLSYDPNYKGSVSSSYNYASTEDWDASGNHIAHVTYGAEISMGPLSAPIMSSGSMYDEMEYSYSDGEAYTNPTAADGGKYTAFHTNFLPYVAQHYDNADDKRQYQVKVNHHLTAFTGCGTYNDPYILSTGTKGGDQLKSIANILNGGSPGDLCIGYSSGTWCTATKNTTNPEQTSHKWYKWEGNFPTGEYVEYVWSATGGEDGNGGFVKKETGGTTLNKDTMRNHLAQAYYQLEGEVEITDDTTTTADDFIGLGSPSGTTDTTGVFRGVIDGQKNSIVNHSDSPLIVSSYGSVVKDLTIEVDREADITLSEGSGSAFAIDSTGCKTYGAVIAKVMGGDNILDNVNVSFSFSEGKKIVVDDA